MTEHPRARRLGLGRRLARERGVERRAQPLRVAAVVLVVGVGRAAVDEPVLAVEHEHVRRDRGAERAGDVLRLVVEVGDRPPLVAHEAAHRVERVGRVARGVVGVDGEEAHAALAVLLGDAAQARVPGDHVGAVVAGDHEHRRGRRRVLRDGVRYAIGVGEGERRNRVADPERGRGDVGHGSSMVARSSSSAASRSRASASESGSVSGSA